MPYVLIKFHRIFLGMLSGKKENGKIVARVEEKLTPDLRKITKIFCRKYTGRR